MRNQQYNGEAPVARAPYSRFSNPRIGGSSMERGTYMSPATTAFGRSSIGPQHGTNNHAPKSSSHLTEKELRANARRREKQEMEREKREAREKAGSEGRWDDKETLRKRTQTAIRENQLLQEEINDLSKHTSSSSKDLPEQRSVEVRPDQIIRRMSIADNNRIDW